MSLKSWLRNHPRLYGLAALMKGHQPIFIDYPVRPVPRYGYGKPPHPLLHARMEKERETYRRALELFLEFREDLARIPVHAPEGSVEPCWENDWFVGLDGVSLYSFLRLRRPRRYVEVGSGFSTRFARRAIRDGGLPTRILSIDPRPRADVESLCDEMVRKPLEDVDLARFGELEAGDLLLIDGSHRCFMNSDVAVAFLDLLPRLPPGLLVAFHDIYLPDDYPPDSAPRYYSEQYMLATLLLAGPGRAEIVLPARFASSDPDLDRVLLPLWDDPRMTGAVRRGGSFWMELR